MCEGKREQRDSCFRRDNDVMAHFDSPAFTALDLVEFKIRHVGDNKYREPATLHMGASLFSV